MDKKGLIGILLIFLIFFVFSWLNTPTDVVKPEDTTIQTSETDPANIENNTIVTDNNTNIDTTAVDSVLDNRLQFKYGLLARAAMGNEEKHVLKNDKFSINFSNKGGKIQEIELFGFEGVKDGSGKEDDVKFPIVLNSHPSNDFGYIIPTATGNISTSDLYFTVEATENKITFTANGDGGIQIIRQYEINPASYEIAYTVNFKGLDGVVERNKPITLNFENYLYSFEKNVEYEKTYSTMYFKPTENGSDYCNCRSTDTEDLSSKPIKWVSSSNQFFNFSIIADESFQGGIMKTVVPDKPESVDYMKKTSADLFLSDKSLADATYSLKLFAGPNQFELLRPYELDLEDIIPFGSSLFGSINRWVVRPIFNFMELFFNNPGISIIFMTLLVKLLLYPLTYKMLYSQAKMSALKPRLSHLKDKFKDDPSGLQMETMKIYREHGVNPLGGCFPMLLQMPIWFALYRFFPASIDFRQAGFLWADDLSTYDEFMSLPFTIPFYGDHVSLFTILWALTTVLYTWYNTKQMGDMMNSNPAMKYVQYFMPVMFLFAFNNFAAGLTCYLLFSNIINILQTYVTKNFIINENKIIAKMDRYKTQPKKKTGFAERLEKAMQEQQKINQERENKLKNKKK